MLRDKMITLKNTKLNNPIVFIGLPGIGLVGKITIDTLIKELKAKKIGTIVGDYFPPMIFVDEKGNIKEYGDEIYTYKNKNNDFVFIAGDFQPDLDDAIAFKSHYKFSKEISEFCKSINAKKVYTFAGMNIGDSRITKKPKITYVINSYFQKKDIEKTLNNPSKNTTISGIAGLTLIDCEKLKIPSICLLGETSSKIYGDFESAKEIILILQKQFKFKINLKDLENEAKKISKAFKKVVEELKKATTNEIIEDIKPTYIR